MILLGVEDFHGHKLIWQSGREVLSKTTVLHWLQHNWSINKGYDNNYNNNIKCAIIIIVIIIIIIIITSSKLENI